MTTRNLCADLERGFDVLRGRKILKHFGSYEEACAYATAGRGRYVRYWAKK